MHRSGARQSVARAILVALVLAAPRAGGADEADVVEASAKCDARSICRFVVTVRHADEGWGHYAEAWEILDAEGHVLATRVLRHPHVGEQPFTRDLRNVAIPMGVGRVRVRARDKRHGFGGAEVEVDVERPEPDGGS